MNYLTLGNPQYQTMGYDDYRLYLILRSTIDD